MRSREQTEHIEVRTHRRSAVRPAVAAAAVAALALAIVLAVTAPGGPVGGPAAVASATPRASQTVAGATATLVATAPQGAAPTTVASPTAQTYRSPLGYSVDMPAGWRRSDLQSLTQPDPPRSDPELLATDIFTTRTPDDERQAMADTHVGFGPTHAYTAFVRIYRNSEGLTPRAFAEEEKGIYGLEAVSVEEITFADRGRTSGGRPAARTTWRFPSGSDTFFATYVEDDQDRMWVIGFYLAPRDMEVPPGATKEDLLRIVGTFSALWLRD